MKITGAAANQPYAPARRAGAALGAGVAPPAADEVRFLGIAEAELTPAVRAALAMLVVELDDLRAEVKRLKARLLDAEAAADEDPLTGACNRGAFVRELTRAVALRERYGTPTCVVYFDIDGFKRVNDRLGHAAGDDALRSLAEHLSVHVRESDVVGRLGGDEFAVLLLHADRGVAAAKAADLARGLALAPTPLSVSYGVRELGPGDEAEAVLAEADAAMFVMKRARNE